MPMLEERFLRRSATIMFSRGTSDC